MAYQIYLSPSGGVTESPVSIQKTSNNQYSWRITSNISGNIGATLYASAYKTPSVWGEEFWLLDQIVPHSDSSNGVDVSHESGYMDIREGAGYTLTLTVPEDTPYVHIYIQGSRVDGNYCPDMITFDYWFCVDAGTPSHRTIMYNNGISWVECIVYYFDGSNWIECIPYYYDGASWKECSK